MERLIEQIRETFTANIGTKLVSLVVAIVLWVVVLGSRNVEVSKEVPLEVLTPPELVVANEMPERLTFRLSGPKAFLRSVLDRREEPIRVNLIGNKPGLVTYRFFSDHIRLPIGVRVLSVNPSSVLIKLEAVKKREVPVRVVTSGALLPGLTIKGIHAFPETVTIKGAESKVESLTEIESVPVNLGELSSSVEQELPLGGRERGDLHAFGLEDFIVVTRAEHEVAHLGAEGGGLLLCGIEGAHEFQGLVGFASHGPDHLPVPLEAGGLDGDQARGQHTAIAGEGHVQREMMTAEL